MIIVVNKKTDKNNAENYDLMALFHLDQNKSKGKSVGQDKKSTEKEIKKATFFDFNIEKLIFGHGKSQ
jgi:hypothetical protein